MPLIVGLLMYFAGAFVLALVYNLWKRRPFWRALHFSTIFGLGIMALVAFLAVTLDLLNITPEPA